MTTTAIVTETTDAEEQATTNANRETRESQHPAARTDALAETGRAHLPGATSGANTINWK